MFLFTDIEYDNAYVRSFKYVRHAKLIAKLLHLRIIAVNAAETRVERDGNDIVINADETLQQHKSFQQHKAVLSARNADCDLISVPDKVEFLNCFPHIPQNFLHKNFPLKNIFTL